MSRGRLVAVIVAVAVVGIVFVVVLPRIASYTAVWRALTGMSSVWLVALGVAAAANVVTFALPWMVALPGLGFVNALQMTQVSTAFTFAVPGGAALGMGASFGMLRSWGFGRGDVGRAVALTGVWNQLSAFLFPAVAAVAVAASGGGGAVGLIAVVAICVFILCAGVLSVALWREGALLGVARVAESLIGIAARLVKKAPPSWRSKDVLGFRSQTLASLGATWPWLTVATLVNQLTGFALLAFSLRAVGIGPARISVAEAFAAWSIGRLLASLPLTPGGIGFIELGMTGILVGFGGNKAQVVAAVLIFRVLSLAPTTLVALVSLASWNRFRPREARSRE